MLYIVPTPIGNLEDITYRAVKVLQSVDLILSEDTRTTGVLLKEYDISCPMRSFHTRNEHQMLPEVMQLLDSQDIALVSDAGTPGISDPGFLLTRACRERNIRVSCLPGASAITPALLMSGLPCDKFHFEGFLPHKKGRTSRLKYLSSLEYTFVLFESPHRIIKTIRQLNEHCGGNRKAAAIKEISKIYEQAFRENLDELLRQFQEIDGKPRGEYVLVVEGMG